jgi:hypothetical protein
MQCNASGIYLSFIRSSIHSFIHASLPVRRLLTPLGCEETRRLPFAPKAENCCSEVERRKERRKEELRSFGFGKERKKSEESFVLERRQHAHICCISLLFFSDGQKNVPRSRGSPSHLP